MESIFGKIKFHYYIITFAVAMILFIIEDARSSHVLDSPFLYGYTGHIIILVLSFAISIYLGLINADLKWRYPFYVAGFVHYIPPFVYIIFVYKDEAGYFFLYYLTLGLIIVFLPHAIVPLLGIVIGSLIYRLKKHSTR